MLNVNQVLSDLPVSTHLQLICNQLEVLIDHIPDAVDIVDFGGTIVKVNRSFEKLYGWKAEEVVGKRLPIIPLDLLGEGESLHNVVKKGQQIIGYETTRIRKDGMAIPIMLTISPLVDAHGKVCGHVAISRDLTEQKKQINFLITHDQLTLLPNRGTFHERAQQALEECNRAHQHLAIVILNLDSFTIINDALGQATGDRLLREVAKRLSAVAGPDQTVARLGSDEFVLLIPGITRSQPVVQLMEKVLEVFQTPFHLENRQDIIITASIGGSVFPRNGKSVEALLQYAYAAMNSAKQAGGNRHVLYQNKLKSSCAKHFLLGQDLWKAFERGELEVFYQPIIEVSTGSVRVLEALLRWKHPKKGWISPAEFIPIAEEMGIIHEIGNWALRKACADIKKLQQPGQAPIKVAVNLSPLQLRDKWLSKQIQGILRETGVDGSLLELEITESVMISNTNITDKLLKEIRALGIQISIDDFGTGYSSLDYLKRYPIDIVKIDKSFIHCKNEQDFAIVKGILTIAQHLGLRVVAEGVESVEQLDFLQQHHCDLYQGYLASKPLPFEQIQALLATQDRLFTEYFAHANESLPLPCDW